MAKKKQQVSPEVSAIENDTETVRQASSVEETKLPETAVDQINDFIFRKVNLLTRRLPNRLLRTPEDIDARKAAAQAKRDRRNAKRLVKA
jgi:hypothetical protein